MANIIKKIVNSMKKFVEKWDKKLAEKSKDKPCCEKKDKGNSCCG